jgi:phage-related protein
LVILFFRIKEGEEMATLADILVTLTLDTDRFSQRLRDVGQELNNFRNHVRQVSTNMNNEFSGNMNGMASSMNAINQASSQASNIINNNMNSVSESMSSTASSSRTLARTLGTDFQDMYRVVRSATEEYENFGSTGNRVSMQVREQFADLPRHLQRYVQRLQEAGQSTHAFSRLNELYGQRRMETWRRTNDYMQERTMQSTRLIQSLARQNIQGLDRQFLRLGERMENNARKGTALNLALTRLGENASPKQVRDEMKLITQGIARARGAMFGFGIITLGAVAGFGALAWHIDERVKPAFEEFKKTWIDAFMPLITAMGSAMVATLGFFTEVNKLIGAFSEAHPLLFKMIGGIALFTAVFGTLLAPLAVGIGLTGGLSAAFSVLWATIAPFVLGMLAVVGTALLLATALVTLWVSVKSLWKNSEAFREAWTNIWNGVKSAVIDGVVNPVKSAWNDLKSAFANLIATFTGGAGTMSNLWTFLGDKIAIVVNGIANVVMPILKGAFSILGQVVVGVINGVIAVMNWLASIWKTHGDTISAVALAIWTKVQEAFGGISTYVMSIMPQIKQIISDGFNAIKVIIDFVMKYIAPVVVGAFQVIWQIISFLMPTILSIIVGTWNNIKSVITATINIIQNVIQLFSNILQGNWSEAWTNVKNIFKNLITLIWNLIQLYFLGKLLKPLSGFISAGKGIIKSGWTGFLNIIKGILTGIKAFIVSVWSAITSSLRGNFTGILNLGRTIFGQMKSTITTIFNGLKSTVRTIWNGIKKLIIDPIRNAKDTVLGIIKTIVGAFAKMKISIPKIKIPKVSVSMKKNGWGIPYPSFKVNWNAKGGIYNGASILGGGQGVGEAGAEAVLPVEHKRYMKPFASSVASHLQAMTGSGVNSEKSAGGNQYTIQFNEPVIIREDADIQRIVDELEKRQRVSERAKGVFSF